MFTLLIIFLSSSCCSLLILSSSFFFNDTATTEIYTLSLHDALPISGRNSTVTSAVARSAPIRRAPIATRPRSEEHTSELQSLRHLVCRLLLEKKKKINHKKKQ